MYGKRCINRMRHFWANLLVYLAPLLAVSLPVVALLIYTGEAMPLSMVVRAQLGSEPVLYRPRFGSRDMNYKLLATETRQPQVLVLGSSRVLQFRAGMFTGAFYNAAAPAWTLNDVQAFLQQLHHNPALLILGVDQPWFNDAFEMPPLAKPSSDLSHLFETGISLLQHTLVFGEGLDINRLLARTEPKSGGLALGFRTIIAGHGFRNDGSEQYGDFLVARYLAPAIERQRHIDMMRGGQAMYARGTDVSAARLNQLAQVLALCQARGIFVVGFSPPFTPTLYDTMMAGGQHTYMQALTEPLNTMFSAYGFAYFDFSNGAWVGGQDTDFFDGWHGSELLNTLLLIRMLETRPALLQTYADGNLLYNAVSRAADTFDLYGS